MNEKNKQQQCILHGEAMIFGSILPEDVTEITPSNKEYHIIADSETTGNHHVIDAVPGVRFFKSKKGTTYMQNDKKTAVRCVLKDRHSAITIAPGTWEFGIQQEYDHFAQNLRAVRD
jgi:hypothetical protein